MLGWHQGFPMLVHPLPTAVSVVYTDNKVLRPCCPSHIKKISCIMSSTYYAVVSHQSRPHV